MSASDERLPGWLKARPQLTVKDATTQHAEFELQGDSSAQAALLKDLIDAGFTVSSYAEHKENLQQSYLRSVATHLENSP